MTPLQIGQQALLVLVETLLVATLLLAFFRLRSIFGLAPIYTVLGVLFHLSALLAATVYLKVTPDLLVNTGSVVLFPANLFVVLFVYIREDAYEARKLIYGLVAANIVVCLMGLLTAQILQDPFVVNPYNLSPDLFIQHPRIAFVSVVALFADTIIIILLYEFVSRRIRRWLFLRIYIAMELVLIFDTLVFVTGSFVEQPAYAAILWSGIVGKTVTALVYSGALSLYLARFDVSEHVPIGELPDLGDIFQVLTYRQKYEHLRLQMTRDSLTNLRNRRFFDDVLHAQLALSKRSGRPVTLLMIDIDHFKQVNDTHGHVEGDRVLKTVASTLRETARASDHVCRYGGEEFAVILPDTALREGMHLAQRILSEVPRACLRAAALGRERCITVTMGLACHPLEAMSAEELMRLADMRLYEGKRTGRNRVVPSEPMDERGLTKEPMTP